MVFESQDIIEDTEFQRFLTSKSLEKSSVKQYVQRIKKYCNFHNLSLSALIEEAETEQNQNLTSIRKRKVNIRISSFLENLNEEGLSVYTMKNYFESIKAIYLYCDIDLGKIAVPSSNKNKSFEETLSLDEIKLAVEFANVRDKGLILMHASSGMGLAEVQNLTYGDFLRAILDYTHKKGYIEPEKLIEMLEGIEDIIPTWRIVRKKTGYPFITFSSPESTRETLRYIKLRIGKANEIKSENDPLFALNSGDMIGEKTYNRIFVRINDKLEFGKLENGQRRFRSHQLRKFFSTQCLWAELDPTMIDWMMGHVIPEQRASYFKVKPNELKKRYMEALPCLTLDEIKRVKVSDPEVKALEKQLEESMKELEEFKSIRDEIDEIKEKIEVKFSDKIGVSKKMKFDKKFS